MRRLEIFICATVIAQFATGSPAGIAYLKLRDDVVYTVAVADNRSACSDSDAELWSYDIHNCFIDRKYNDGGQDLDNIIDRVLEHSKDCVQRSVKECRPDYQGFLGIMKKVIEQMKDYCHLYLDDIYRGRENIKDLDCVESSLSEETYKNCFKSLFDNSYVPEKFFERKVEKAISCVNKANKLCSKTAKSSLNNIVRIIFGVTQPEDDDIEEVVTSTPKPTPAPMRWYDYIFQPFITAWNAIRNFFGSWF